MKAIEIGEELGEIFAFGNWSHFISIARLLLYPTIYEPTGNASESQTSPAIANSLLNQEDIMDQLTFLK